MGPMLYVHHKETLNTAKAGLPFNETDKLKIYFQLPPCIRD